MERPARRGSFSEIDQFVKPIHRIRDRGRNPGDAVVAGTDDRRPSMFVFAEDFTVFGGSLAGRRRQDLQILAWPSTQAPVIGLRTQWRPDSEGVPSLDGHDRIFRRNVRASG
jgi:acetyl-CoA carboxylase carboxyltransferase component